MESTVASCVAQLANGANFTLNTFGNGYGEPGADLGRLPKELGDWGRRLEDRAYKE